MTLPLEETLGRPQHVSLEGLARRLAEIGPHAFDSARREVRVIGEGLHGVGGPELMVRILERAESISLKAGGPTVERTIETAWNGIGQWQA